MPILRSRKFQSKNSEDKENQNTNKDQQRTSKKVSNKTRVGRHSKITESELKVINCNSEKQYTRKHRKPVKNKMVNEEEKSNPIPEETVEDKTPKITDNELNKPVTENKIVKTTADEPMDVADNTEDNEECSPIKKPKMNAKEELDSEKKDETNKSGLEELKGKVELENVAEKGNEQDDEKPESSNIKIKGISLKSSQSTTKPSEESSPGSNLPKQLLTVISNLYLNVGERLHLDFPPRCLDDLAFCHRHHYRSELPEAPMTSQAHSLRSALQHYRYVLFINATTDMCHRGEFPGKGIFTKLIELVLSINYVTKQTSDKISIYEQSYHKSIELFSMIVRTFPPCWHKMRTYYVGFLEYGLDLTKLKNDKEKALSKSTKIFDILLDLLEEDLKSSKSAVQNERLEATSPIPNSELSICSDYWNQNEYEQRERQKQTYDALPNDQKLERVLTALRLLLQILENDLAMWMLHHNKKTKEWIFCAENRPLIVVLCELTQYTRMTRVARRIFSVYSKAAAKGWNKKHLRVLERFISLLMVASNTADMENTAIGVKYPYLGEQTKTLIQEFFKIFKAHNREEISKYIETIELLRIPYVRYEFIDNLLIMFQFTNSEPLSPQKIALDIAKKRWLKYKPAAELTSLADDISREQYLHLLLVALRSYCEFHGSKTFLHVITDAKEIFPLTTTNDSVHRWPTRGSGVLVLKKMANDIALLTSKIKMTVRMSKPKVVLPLADICIDEAIILKYRNDLKFTVSLQNVLLKQKETYPDVDFTNWLEYLNDFSPKNSTKKEEN